LVLGGRRPTNIKRLIEKLQVHSALGTPGVTFIWDAVETINVFLSRFLF